MTSEFSPDPNRSKAINPHNFRTGLDIGNGGLEEVSKELFGLEYLENLGKYEIAKERVLKYLRRKCPSNYRELGELPSNLSLKLIIKYKLVINKI